MPIQAKIFQIYSCAVMLPRSHAGHDVRERWEGEGGPGSSHGTSLSFDAVSQHKNLLGSELTFLFTKGQQAAYTRN